MSKRPHPSSPSSDLKRKGSIKRPKNQNEPIARGDSNDGKADSNKVFITPKLPGKPPQLVPFPRRPPLQAQSQNQAQASSRTLNSVQKEVAGGRQSSRHEGRADVARSLSNARATQPLTAARPGQKGPGTVQGRARAHTVTGAPFASSHDTVNKSQDFRNDLRTPTSASQAVATVPARKPTAAPVPAPKGSHKRRQSTVITNSPWTRAQLYPEFSSLIIVLFHLPAQPDAGNLSKVTYIAPPSSTPPAFVETGVHFYFMLALSQLLDSAKEELENIEREIVFYEVFFYVALASWMSSGCQRHVYRDKGQELHKSSSKSAVATGPKETPIPRTMEQLILHGVLEALYNRKNRTASPWIHVHISNYIKYSSWLYEDQRKLLSNVSVANLAYAAETLLSYSITYLNEHRQDIDPSLSVAGELNSVEETDYTRLALAQLFPKNDQGKFSDENRRFKQALKLK